MDVRQISGIVFDIKKFSIHDGPGIRTTVFLKGCPLRCWWCHNPESQRLQPEIMLRGQRCIECAACLEACAQGAISINGDGVVTDRALCIQCGICTESCYAEAREVVGRRMTVTQVMAEIEKDLSFYDESGGGVTFSGGDPLLQRDFLLALLIACREKEIHTAVDTSGAFSWRTLDMIRPYVDLFLYDVKTMDDERHKHVTGVSNQLILHNLQALSALGHKIVLRLVVVPGVNDEEENIRRTAAFATTLPHLESVSLLPYHDTAVHKYANLDRVYPLPAVAAPETERMRHFAEILREYGLVVNIGG
jgi:pyruvate formate lyase activating enzyme